MKLFYFWNEKHLQHQFGFKPGAKMPMVTGQSMDKRVHARATCRRMEMGDFALILPEKKKDDVDFWAQDLANVHTDQDWG